MSAIYGLVRFDGEPVQPEQLERMGAASAHWGPDGQAVWRADSAGLACQRLHSTPESIHERQPRQMADGRWLASAARLDNRSELCRALGVPAAELSALPDGGLIELAYLRWGEACVEHLLGDWALAVWEAAARRLFLARDQYGNTPLYYHANSKYLAFATGRVALLRLDPALSEIDDLYVAQVMLAWPVYHGERTAHARLRRLPPAHTLTATPQGVKVRQYWRMEDAPALPLRSLDEAAEGLRAVFDEAVRCRLRSRGPIATELSGGLDSGSIMATAAYLLGEDGPALTAYTSVPLAETAPFVNAERRFGDEWPLAALNARQAAQTHPRLRHVPIRAEDVSVLAGIEHSLRAHGEPAHAAGNAYWIAAVMRQVRAEGANVLLTGQGGNATISWTGFRSSRPRAQWGQLRPSPAEGPPGWRRQLLYRLPRAWATGLRVAQARRAEAWRSRTALHPDLARRLDVAGRSAEQFAVDPRETTPLAARYRILKPGRSILGALVTESSAPDGIESRDPSVDLRVITFCLGVPDHLFTDPATGLDRMVIRAAMAGRVPDEVRLNRRRGHQAADLPLRLRRERDAVEATLDELEHSAAAGYVSLPALRRAWATAQTEESPDALRAAATVLTRGLMAGLFVLRNRDWAAAAAAQPAD